MRLLSLTGLLLGLTLAAGCHGGGHHDHDRSRPGGYCRHRHYDYRPRHYEGHHRHRDHHHEGGRHGHGRHDGHRRG